MKVLITGGAGYIGSLLCEYLLSQKFKASIDNFFSQNSLNHIIMIKILMLLVWMLESRANKTWKKTMQLSL